MPDHDPARAAARERFPRGLSQPASGFRFSVDALLLASFARPKGARGLDLGCGCGVVGLAVLLRCPENPFRMLGLDVNPDMAAAARANAALLGLGDRFAAHVGDVGEWAGQGARGASAQAALMTEGDGAMGSGGPETWAESTPVRREMKSGANGAPTDHALAPESFDLVVCNPPYRRPGQGRDCPDPGRSLGRFESGAGLPAFTRAAGRLLKNRGRAAFIFPAERLPDLFMALRESRLEPKILRLVHSREGEPARLALVEAVKSAAPGLRAEPPLVLYGQGAASRTLSPQALAFCPFLGCNPARG